MLFKMNPFLLLITCVCACAHAGFVSNYTLRNSQSKIFLDVGGFKVHLDPRKPRQESLSHQKGDGYKKIPEYLSAYGRFQDGVNQIQFAVDNYISKNWKKEINITHVNFLSFLFTMEALTKDIRYHGWNYHEMFYNTLAPMYAQFGINIPATAAKIVSCYMDQAIDKVERIRSLIENSFVKPVCQKPCKLKPETPPEIPDCCQYLLHAIIQMSTNLGSDVDFLLYFKKISKSHIKKIKKLIPIVSKDPKTFVKNGQKELRPYLELNVKLQETYFPGEDICLPLFDDPSIKKKEVLLG